MTGEALLGVNGGLRQLRSTELHSFVKFLTVLFVRGGLLSLLDHHVDVFVLLDGLLGA